MTAQGDIATAVKSLLDTLLVDGGLCAVGYGYRTARIFDLEQGSPAYSLSYEGHRQRLPTQEDDYFFTLIVAARYDGYDEEEQVATTLKNIESAVKVAFNRVGSYGSRVDGSGNTLWLAVTYPQQSQLPATPVTAKGWRVLRIFMQFTR